MPMLSLARVASLRKDPCRLFIWWMSVKAARSRGGISRSSEPDEAEGGKGEVLHEILRCDVSAVNRNPVDVG